MQKCLMAIGGGTEAYIGLQTAKAMGLKLIVVDGNPSAPGFELADKKLVISTYDADEIANQAETLVCAGTRIDGVIAMCADVPLSVSSVALRLKLPGLSLNAAQWLSDKLLMKARLQAKGIPIPRFRAASSVEDLKSAATEWGFPLVVKPVDSRGARGVQYIDAISQFPQALACAQAESPTGRAMVEEYLTGLQVSTETLVSDNKCYTLGFADRNYEWLERTKPFMIENGGDAPSALPTAHQNDIIQVAEQAALALGIHVGVAKGDMVMTPSGAKVIEMAGRLSGGYFSTTQIPLATGINFIEKAIKLALGETLSADEVTPRQHKAVAIRYLDLPVGTVQSITGIEAAKHAPGVHMLSIAIAPGSQIQPLENHTQRSGFVITSAATKADAISAAYNALNLIKVDYVDQ